MKQFNSLYYPETVCLSEPILKTLLLLYDKIYFLPIDTSLNPRQLTISSRFSINDSLLASAFGSREDAYYTLMYSSDKSIWDDRLKHLMEMYDYLEESKIVIPLNDKNFEDPSNWHPLKSSVDSDIADTKFLYYCDEYRNERFDIPPLPEESKIKVNGFAMRPPAYKRELALSSLCSERINTTLYFANANNLIPVSNQKLYIKLLSLKLERTIDNPIFQKERHLLDQKQKMRYSLLSWDICTEIIPQDLLIEKNIKHILKYKNETIGLQEKFRNSLNNLQLMVSEQPWENAFLEEIDKIVKLKIIPEAEKIKEDKKIIWEKLFSEVIKITTRLLIPIYSIHLIPNLSYLDLIFYSTAAWIGGIFPKLLNAWQEEKKIRRNSLFFLINFK